MKGDKGDLSGGGGGAGVINQNTPGGSSQNGPGLWMPIRYVINDTILGQVKLVNKANELLDVDDVNFNQLVGKDIGYNFFGKIMRNGIGLALPTDSGWKTALDAWTGVDNTRDVISHVKNAKVLRQANVLKQAGDFKGLAEIADKIPKPMTGLSKFLGYGGIALSGGEGIYNTYKAFTADSGQETLDYSMKAVGNVGGVLMSAAPFAGPAAGIVAGAGAVLWGASTIYANRKQIGQGLKWTGEKIVQGAKVVGEGIKKAGKVVGDGLKKIGSWFK